MKTTEPITIEVLIDAARVFQNASEDERKSLQSKVSAILKLADPTKQSTVKLRTIMDEISGEAQAKGLTPEILEFILHDSE